MKRTKIRAVDTDGNERVFESIEICAAKLGVTHSQVMRKMLYNNRDPLITPCTTTARRLARYKFYRVEDADE